jgi:O-6-methylguanine DNA methyltransferase
VTVSGGRLVGVELPPVHSMASATRGRVEKGQAAAGAETAKADAAALRRWVGELEAYFRGERLAWTAEESGLDGLFGGGFRKAVYSALLSVPAGVTVSYGALAEMAGYPRAARAVGTAMATNPIPIVVPCHRVIRADGTLGNFGNDPALKELLLTHERKHAGQGVGKR